MFPVFLLWWQKRFLTLAEKDYVIDLSFIYSDWYSRVKCVLRGGAVSERWKDKPPTCRDMLSADKTFSLLRLKSTNWNKVCSLFQRVRSCSKGSLRYVMRQVMMGCVMRQDWHILNKFNDFLNADCVQFWVIFFPSFIIDVSSCVQGTIWER